MWCCPGEQVHWRRRGRLLPWLAEQPCSTLGLHLQQGGQLGSSAGSVVWWRRGGLRTAEWQRQRSCLRGKHPCVLLFDGPDASQAGQGTACGPMQPVLSELGMIRDYRRLSHFREPILTHSTYLAGQGHAHPAQWPPDHAAPRCQPRALPAQALEGRRVVQPLVGRDVVYTCSNIKMQGLQTWQLYSPDSRQQNVHQPLPLLAMATHLSGVHSGKLLLVF